MRGPDAPPYRRKVGGVAIEVRGLSSRCDTWRRGLASSSHGSDTVLGTFAKAASLHGFGRFLLSNDFPGVELDKHGSIRLDLLDGHRQAEVIQEQELKLQVVKLGQRQSSDLLECQR